MVYTVNAYIPTKWKVLPYRVPAGERYYRVWVDADSDHFINISTEQREAPDQYIGNRPPVAMLGLLEAKALRHLLDGFIERAEANRAAQPKDEFSEVYNLPEGQTMDQLIESATSQFVRSVQRSYGNPHKSKELTEEEMDWRRARAAAIRQREQAIHNTTG